MSSYVTDFGIFPPMSSFSSGTTKSVSFMPSGEDALLEEAAEGPVDHFDHPSQSTPYWKRSPGW
ncbi:hypothetical protein DIPPA_09656 [Diplonema papillatum]|nr:hypothetical protein DIPPA_09656 [Diplonema papillatum]